MKKKIYLIRSSSTRFGGAENYLYRLSSALKNKKIDHEITHSSLPDFIPSWLKALVFNMQLCLKKNNKFYYSLDRITCPDLYRAGDGVHKVLLSLEKKSKLNLLHPVYLYLERKCFNNAKLIIANSNMVKQQIIDTYHIESKKIEVIYNGIKFKKNSYDKSFEKISKEFQIKKNQPIVLFVGSGFKRKGVAEFLKIFSQINSPDVKGFVIGKEKHIKFYESMSKKLRVDHQVTFTGPRTDVDDFYSISDILLFPTHYDPFSNVVLEAMYFENAVFTTNFNGASEILDPSFIMNNPYDTKVASLIDKLLTDQSALNKIKARNKKISKLFSIEKNLDQTLEVITKIG